SPGGVLAAVGWLAASAVYSYYLNDLGHASQTYGVFAGVVVLLVWLFVAGLAVLLGAELNRELERRLPVTAAATPEQTGSPPGHR
ncbi:MAG: YhjD/YihY/BrkB family envelope integrity protein, partial [Acidimicrobiales bacterium]